MDLLQVSNKPQVLYNKSETPKTDSISLSVNNSNNKSKNKNKNKLIAYVSGGLAIAAGIIFALVKAKKGKGTSNAIKNVGEVISSNSSKSTQTGEISQLNKKLAEQDTEIINIEKKLEESINNSRNGSAIKTESKHETTPSSVLTPETQPLQTIKKQVSEVVEPATIEEQTNRAYTQYAHKLATELKLEDKEALIKEALPDLMPLNNNKDALEAVLQHINPQNKDFVVKTAVPAILRNTEVLDLSKAMGMALKSVSPETVDCIDRLAANAKRFKINSQVDSINLLKSLTKDNKEFAFEELFPYLAENMDKYKIRQSAIMGRFLDVVTPQNKDFVLNEALPELLKSSDIDITNALKITKHLNKDNLKNVQTIADKVEELGLKDEYGFLDVDKFVKALENK